MKGKSGERWVLLGTTAAYLLIGLEVLFMITPFALYFYGVYGPMLAFLSSWPVTAWTVDFFMPHMVFVDDPLLIGLSYLQALFVVGLVLFLLAAVPLYWGRLTGRGVVSFGFYARIRHPQYLFLALSGLGLLLYWPRFIVLIFYVTMLFVYYLLARNEEWRMRREQPGSYQAYMERSWMFLPGEPGGRFFNGLFGWIRPRWLGLVGCYVVTLSLAVGVGFLLRQHTLEHLPRTRAGGMELVSVYPRPEREMEALYALVSDIPRVRKTLATGDVSLVYLMPGDFFLTGLILREGPRWAPHKLELYPELRDPEAHRHSGGLVKFFRLGYKFFRTIGTARRVYDYERLVLVKTLGPDGAVVAPGAALAAGIRRWPVLVVDIDAETREVLGVTPVSGENSWGRLPMPNF